MSLEKYFGGLCNFKTPTADGSKKHFTTLPWQTEKLGPYAGPIVQRMHTEIKPLMHTLQGTNISHLGKRKIIFKMPFLDDMLVPWRVHYSPIENQLTQVALAGTLGCQL